MHEKSWIILMKAKKRRKKTPATNPWLKRKFYETKNNYSNDITNYYVENKNQQNISIQMTLSQSVTPCINYG